MTKRELIDQILHENHTAEPAFLAQFSDEQLREYLIHLRWLKQPRLRGDASRFDRYFRNCPSVLSPPRRWRTPGDVPGGSPQDALDLSAPPVPPQATPSQGAPPAAPAEPETSGVPLLPPIQELELDASLPGDAETLEAMQLSPQERTELTSSAEDVSEAEDPPPARDPSPTPDPQATPPPFTDTTTDEQTWLF